MPSSNRDASTLTQFRQARALYAYNRKLKEDFAAGRSIMREQPSMPLNEVVIQRTLGGPVQIVSQAIVEQGCACDGLATSALGYPANTSSA